MCWNFIIRKCSVFAITSSVHSTLYSTHMRTLYMHNVSCVCVWNFWMNTVYTCSMCTVYYDDCSTHVHVFLYNLLHLHVHVDYNVSFFRELGKVSCSISFLLPHQEEVIMTHFLVHNTLYWGHLEHKDTSINRASPVCVHYSHWHKDTALHVHTSKGWRVPMYCSIRGANISRHIILQIALKTLKSKPVLNKANPWLYIHKLFYIWHYYGIHTVCCLFPFPSR